MRQFGCVVHDFHAAPSEHVARTYQHRITDKFGHFQRFFDARDSCSGRLRDAKVAQELLETAAVFWKVDAFGAGAQYRHTGPCQRVGQVNRGLPAELDDWRRVSVSAVDVIRVFIIQDIADALFVQRFEIKPVAGVEVSGNGFRIGVDHDALVTGLF